MPTTVTDTERDVEKIVKQFVNARGFVIQSRSEIGPIKDSYLTGQGCI